MIDLDRLSPDAQRQAREQLGIKRGKPKMPKRVDQSPLWIRAWRAFGEPLIQWSPEYRFHESRAWRFDWSLPNLHIAVEVDGGRWRVGGGRHGSDEDREKLNEAAARGWMVFRFSPAQLKTDPEACVAVVTRGIDRRAE